MIQPQRTLIKPSSLHDLLRQHHDTTTKKTDTAEDRINANNPALPTPGAANDTIGNATNATSGNPGIGASNEAQVSSDGATPFGDMLARDDTTTWKQHLGNFQIKLDVSITQALPQLTKHLQQHDTSAFWDLWCRTFEQTLFTFTNTNHDTAKKYAGHGRTKFITQLHNINTS